MPARADAILIVEDNPDDLHFLVRAFRRCGSTVPLRIAQDGEQAMDYLESLRDGEDRLLAVLLDLKLPRLSGFEVLARIKSDPQLRRVPVVVLTSSAESADIARAYDLGANSYLVKPPETLALGNLVESLERYWVRENRTAASGGAA